MTEDEILEEASFIQAFERWPMWPILPVKHVDRGDMENRDEGHGIVLAGNLTTVYVHNLYALVPGIPVQDQVKDSKKHTFDSVEEMVRAGWIGD